MNNPILPDHDELISRTERDLIDSYDEELEMENEDRSAEDVLAGGAVTRSDAEKTRARAARGLFPQPRAAGDPGAGVLLGKP